MLDWTDPYGYARPMDAACMIYGITGRLRMAAFLGQVGHESGRGKWTKEIWGPTEAQKGYEGRKDLGNIRPGDGSWFRGRGLIQITGRANYEAAAKALGVPLDQLPAWLEGREGAVTSAAWWWRQHGCNELADAAGTEAGFKALTRRINGGVNGLDERKRLYAAALKALG
jgi:putative chitinase